MPYLSILTRVITSLGLAVLLTACGNSHPSNSTPTVVNTASDSTLTIPFEKYTLENGLDVILHQDRSDPVVAINLAAHVGSAREIKGRTGFAHLFEHLLFLDSENLGYGGLDEMNTRIGGEGTNGFTTNDMTQYFQAAPSDALEKIIWAEADKLGWFIQTVTQEVLDNEKQVVKNEKRQSFDNRPYGHNSFVINKALYPEDHPYNWSIIGSLADLDASTLQDVKNFYARWYVPNNVTVTLTGDFEIKAAKALIEKYFGEIPRGQDITPLSNRPSPLTSVKSFYHEDNFATVPRLTRVWPGVPAYHKDSAALDILVSYLSEGKDAPLNKVMVDAEKVTSNVDMFNFNKEIAGEIYLFIDANEDKNIDGLIAPLDKGFAAFEGNGIPQKSLDRIKTKFEVAFYDDIQSALGKAIKLSEYNIYTDDPSAYKKTLADIQSVSVEDVQRVYQTYIKNKPYVTTSFVPKGRPDMALSGAVKAEIVEEKIVNGAEAQIDFDPAARIINTPTPSRFDRTQEPDFGPAYTLKAPEIEQETLQNGLKVFSIYSDEIPLVNFSLQLDAGRMRGNVKAPGVPALTADLLLKGTAHKTPAELEAAIESLGSTLSITNGATGTFIIGTALARKLQPTLEIVHEILTAPRWDAEEFALLKRKTLQSIIQSEGDASTIAAREMAKLNYPADHILHYMPYGPKDALDAITLEDLKEFYNRHYSYNHSQLRIVGASNIDAIKAALCCDPLPTSNTPLPAAKLDAPYAVETSKVYFYDLPDAKQSVLRIERPSLPATASDFPLAGAINFPLGGIYTSKLNTELRVKRGYTYGIFSGFSGQKDRGSFTIRSSVRSNVTFEALNLIKDIVSRYGPDFTQEELDTLKQALLRGQALKTESLSDKLGVLSNMSAYDYPANYRERDAKAIAAMTLEDFKDLSTKYIRAEAMNYLVVGDAKTQVNGLKALGFGDPIMLKSAK